MHIDIHNSKVSVNGGTPFTMAPGTSVTVGAATLHCDAHGMVSVVGGGEGVSVSSRIDHVPPGANIVGLVIGTDTPRVPRQRQPVTEPDMDEVYRAVRDGNVSEAHSRVIARDYPHLAALTASDWVRLVAAMDAADADTEAGEGAEALGRVLRVADDLGAGTDFLRFLLAMLRTDTAGEGR
ncbi:hypothetical protein [Glycomyces sp. MUSA5-2]|uniref:hypothetical protein n=1 Tax=Glycomyces sp. MUSA5-2 TaxID=2053002 RepID=UPI00300B9589